MARGINYLPLAKGHVEITLIEITDPEWDYYHTHPALQQADALYYLYRFG